MRSKLLEWYPDSDEGIARRAGSAGRALLLCLAALSFILIAGLHVEAAIAADGQVSSGRLRTTLEGVTGKFAAQDGSPVAVYFAADNVLRGSYKGRRFAGRWWTKDNLLCFDLPGPIDDGCWVVVHRHDRHYQLFTSTGEPVSNLEIESGNPNHF